MLFSTLMWKLYVKHFYENAAKIAKKAYKENMTLKQAASELGLVSEDDFDKTIDSKRMV